MQDINSGLRRLAGPRVRRVLVRLCASVAVMTGLSAVSRQEPPSAPLPMRTVVAAPDRAEMRTASLPAAAAPVLHLAALSPSNRSAEGKTARLRPATTARKTPLAANVPYFDECEPACESRDPMLVRAASEQDLQDIETEEAVFDTSPPSDEPEVFPVEDVAEVVPDPAGRPGLLGRVTQGVAAAAGSGTRQVVAGLGHLSPW